jgi:UDP-N-acetylmuramoyl-tripeptide--D-alanyl-D-alanine ligase
MQLGLLAQIVQGEIRHQSFCQLEFHGVSMDTRKINAGNLYIAYPGPRFDGHDYVIEAQRQGAAAALVSSWVDCDFPQIKVADTLHALQQYAQWHREQFNPTVIAITGSCGKTSTRSLLQSILSVNHSALATEGNYNNHIGVPLMLLRLNAEHAYAVFELGASAIGEIADLASWVKPAVSLITQAGYAHIEGFGSLENVAKAKGEIYSALSTSGCAIINADDHFAEYWRGLLTQQKILTFARNHPADVYAANVQVSDGLSFRLHVNQDSTDIHLNMLGEHNIDNALAAAAAATAVGISIDDIKQGLQSAAQVQGRMCGAKGFSGALVIDDAYNANPSSMRAAINALRSVEGYKRRILVLGDMLELGPTADDKHREVAQYAKQQGIDLLFTFGQLARQCVDVFGEHGLHCSSHEELVTQLKSQLNVDTAVLVKGSNSLGLRQVADALME